MTQVISSSGPTSLVTKGTFVITDTQYHQTNGVYPARLIGGSSTTTNRYTYNEKSVDTNKSSAKTPKFYQLIKTGGILPVNYFYNTSTVKQYNYRVLKKISSNNGYVASVRTEIGPYNDGYISEASWVNADLSSSELAVLDREARVKVRLALKDMQVNVAQIIAERNKTASSIAKIVKTIAEVILRLRHGDIVGAASAVGQHVGYRKRRAAARGNPSEAAANAWLELQYAIKPLLMDIDGMCKALAAHKYPKATGRAVATATKVVDRVFMEGNRKVINQGSVKIRYVVYYQVNYPEMPSYTALGLTNPALVAWELVPFSFVLDWLLPIGDWLSSLDATVGLQFSDGSMSVKKDITQTYQTRRVTVQNGTYTWGTYSNREECFDVSSSKVERLERTKLTSFPAVAFPPFKNPASLMHLATSMALLRKALSSIGRR